MAIRHSPQQVCRAMSLATLVALTGCMPPISPRPYIAVDTPFDPAPLAKQMGQGTASIVGQTFTRTVGGEVRYGAGVAVYLVPVDGYVRECLNAVLAGHSDCGSNLIQFRQATTADAEGHFTFKGIKAGDWYVESTITWGVPGVGGGISSTGGTFRKILTLHEGEAATVILD